MKKIKKSPKPLCSIWMLCPTIDKEIQDIRQQLIAGVGRAKVFVKKASISIPFPHEIVNKFRKTGKGREDRTANIFK
jgi:uncharacterized protein (DUF4415 family)